MRYALINDGVVDNVVECTEEFADRLRTRYQAVVQTEEAGPGWTWDGETFSEPAPEPQPVPENNP
ncbi:hypothetical protein GO986_09145 [Deinococcus sp. HMF7620]|uniref:Uncharacterized protein n=1 Tax=Deinococcus arboris TaxID=2682977 RepID=A0A7C9HY39_9DEIO|nr:hypothetical protein [Deinococcus arboris]MVN86930.1 hypothetical protein [Deinococcus arboris]